MELKEQLQEVFREVFDDEEIVIFEEMTANDIEDWDSLMHIQLIVAIEKAFQVKFSTKDVKNIKNVGEFMALIERKRA